MPWDEDRFCEFKPRNVRRQQPVEEPEVTEKEEAPVRDAPPVDLIGVIVRALAPFVEARKAVVEAIRVFGGIAPCPG
jgi:hypothetical protein